MAQEALAAATREAMLLFLQLGGPPLLALLVVGLTISVLQALTQVQEATLAFIPKIFAAGIVLLLAGPFMLAALRGYALALFDRAILLGAAPG
jgi:flagellar biosynthetic protein FliQ